MRRSENLAEEMRRLVGPYELLDLPDRGSVTLKISSWERGSILIHPRYPGAPAEKEIPVIRVHLMPGVKKCPPMYYDITSKTLNAQLLPMLMAADFKDYSYKIVKFGVAPRARFTLERTPL